MANKVVFELRVIQFWSVMLLREKKILVISNRTLPVRTLGARVLSSAVSGFCQVFIVTRRLWLRLSICSSRQTNRPTFEFTSDEQMSICTSSRVRTAIVSYPKRTTRPTRLRYLLCLNFILSCYLFRKD